MYRSQCYFCLLLSLPLPLMYLCYSLWLCRLGRLCHFNLSNFKCHFNCYFNIKVSSVCSAILKYSFNKMFERNLFVVFKPIKNNAVLLPESYFRILQIHVRILNHTKMLSKVSHFCNNKIVQ